METRIREKLGLSSNMDTYFMRVPFEYWQAVGIKPQPYNDNVGEYDFIHAFFDTFEECENFFDVLMSKSNDHTLLWLSFNNPINENDIEKLAAENNLQITDTMDLLNRQTFRLA
jgi:hypothetical protein